MTYFSVWSLSSSLLGKGLKNLESSSSDLSEFLITYNELYFLSLGVAKVVYLDYEFSYTWLQAAAKEVPLNL